jgi:hypothetical protein
MPVLTAGDGAGESAGSGMPTADAPHEVYRQNFAENFGNGGANANGALP